MSPRPAHGALLALCLTACGTDEPPEAALPCDVDAVLAEVCRDCHAAPPREGVPLSLMTYADTQAPYNQPPAFVDTPVWKVMGSALRAGVMPESPATISDADLAVLLDWVDRGAPAAGAGEMCAAPQRLLIDRFTLKGGRRCELSRL